MAEQGVQRGLREGGILDARSERLFVPGHPWPVAICMWIDDEEHLALAEGFKAFAKTWPGFGNEGRREGGFHV